MYDFRNLSPIDFEDLVRDLLQKRLGVRMESFKVGRDQGIDFRFAAAGGNVIVQAKHFFKSGENKLVKAAQQENTKVKKLSPNRYIFVTSLSMSNTLKENLLAALSDAPLSREDIIGQEDLNGYLIDYPEIEKAHFKLWLGSTSVLERMLNSGVYNRTETEIFLIADMIPKFVQNDSVTQAEKILENDGTVIIAGDPGVGKTTLARMLLSLHIAQGWEPFVVSDMEEAFRVSTKGTKKLIFFDDFLGQVRLSTDHVRGLDQRLPPFLQRVQINKDLRFILTTREIILNQAKMLSEKLSSQTIQKKKYILDVGKYTREVKARILYNHIYFSDLVFDQIETLLKGDFFLEIIDHPNFNPRLIDILLRKDYPVISGESLKEAVVRILASPHELWARPYQDHISSDGKALMLALLINSEAVSLASLRATFSRVSAALEPSFALAQAQIRFASSLRELEGAVVSVVNRTARFANPGIRDFLQAKIVEDDLVPSILLQIETFDEVSQLWAIFTRQQLAPSPLGAKLWLDALERMLDNSTAGPIGQIEMVLKVFDVYHAHDDFSSVVVAAGEQLRLSSLDNDDVTSICRLLEDVTLHLLPLEMQDDLLALVTNAACQILREAGQFLTFEELTTLYDTLCTSSNNTKEVKEAIESALDAYLPSVDSEMDNFSSVDEVDEFEKQLKNLFKRTAYPGELPHKDIRYKREYLADKEDIATDDSYQSAWKKLDLRMNASTESIRSLFHSLKAFKD